MNKYKNTKNQLINDLQKKDQLIAELRIQFENYRRQSGNPSKKEHKANSSNTKNNEKTDKFNETKRSFHSKTFGKFSNGELSQFSHGHNDEFSVKKYNDRSFERNDTDHRTDERHDKIHRTTENRDKIYRTDKKPKVVCCYNEDCIRDSGDKNENFNRDSGRRRGSSSKHKNSRDRSNCDVCHRKKPVEKLSPATEILVDNVKFGRTPSRDVLNDLEEKISYF